MFPAADSASGSPGIEAQAGGGSSGTSAAADSTSGTLNSEALKSAFDNGSNPLVENYEPVPFVNPKSSHLLPNISSDSRSESTENQKPPAKKHKKK